MGAPQRNGCRPWQYFLIMPRPVRAVGSFLRRNLRLPKGWPDALLQVAIWVCVDSVYELVRGLTEGSHVAAFANGNRVVELEQTTHTFFEVDFQRLILDQHFPALNRLAHQREHRAVFDFLVN